jgi:hypothetical protein
MAKRKRRKRTNNHLQNITHKSTDGVTRTPLKTGGELRCSRNVLKKQHAQFDVFQS